MQLTKRSAPHFRDSPEGMVLIATRTAEDAPLRFPPAEFSLGAVAPVDVPVGPRGRLYTYTVVHVGRDQAPYGLAMVDFEPGLRVFGRLVLDAEHAAQLDAHVRVVPYALADGTPDYAFEVVP